LRAELFELTTLKRISLRYQMCVSRNSNALLNLEVIQRGKGIMGQEKMRVGPSEDATRRPALFSVTQLSGLLDGDRHRTYRRGGGKSRLKIITVQVKRPPARWAQGSRTGWARGETLYIHTLPS